MIDVRAISHDVGKQGAHLMGVPRFHPKKRSLTLPSRQSHRSAPSHQTLVSKTRVQVVRVKMKIDHDVVNDALARYRGIVNSDTWIPPSEVSHETSLGRGLKRELTCQGPCLRRADCQLTGSSTEDEKLALMLCNGPISPISRSDDSLSPTASCFRTPRIPMLNEDGRGLLGSKMQSESSAMRKSEA
eukprot:49473-Rhodomonas_salina.2